VLDHLDDGIIDLTTHILNSTQL